MMNFTFQNKLIVTLAILLTVFGFAGKGQLSVDRVDLLEGELSNSYDLAVDKHGASYICGYFHSELYLDPISPSFYFQSKGYNDAFVQKTDAAGNFVWAAQFGSNGFEEAYDITVDNNSNVIITGLFNGTVDFDPDPNNTFDLSALGSDDNFIVKLNSAGDLVWALQLNGTGYDHIQNLTTDKHGNIYLVGAFSGTIDFDTGAATKNLTANSLSDGFLLKLNPQGSFEWVKQWTSTGDVALMDVVVDDMNKIHICGVYSGTTDFDPSTSQNLVSSSLTNHEAFVQTLDDQGFTTLLYTPSGPGADYIQEIEVDNHGDIYFAGSFSDSINMAAGSKLYSNGANDLFLGKVSGTGNYLWSYSIGGSSESLASIKIDMLGNLYAVGNFKDSLRLRSSSDTTVFPSIGSRDIFAIGLAGNGSFLWLDRIGSGAHEDCFGFDIDASGNFYLSGNLGPTAFDFDPSSNIYNIPSTRRGGVFLAKMQSHTFSVNEPRPIPKFYIYPNPSSDILNIEWSEGEELRSIRIYDLKGRKLDEQQIIHDGLSSTQLSIENLELGSYIVEVKTKNGVSKQKVIHKK